MSVVIAQIDIAAPPERVWEVAMDPRTTTDWVTIVRDVGPWDDGPLVEGFRMDQRLHLRGVTFKVEWTLQEVRPPEFARWVGKGPARARAIIEDRLTPTATGTHFDYRNEFHTPFWPDGRDRGEGGHGRHPRARGQRLAHRSEGTDRSRPPLTPHV